MKDERAHLQLFDLIAREWAVDSPVTQIVFNATDTAVAFACANGAIHLAATADNASPNLRTRRAIDTGRLTIAPRDKPFAMLKTADYTAGRSTTVAPHGLVNFAFGKDTGRINTLTPGGLSVYLAAKAPGRLSAITASPDGELVALACGSDIHLSGVSGDAPSVLHAIAPVSALAFSPDGKTLAVAHGAGVTRWSVKAQDQAPILTPMAVEPIDVVWHDDGLWLAACLGAEGFCLVDATTNTALLHGSFPSPVRTIAFSRSTGAVVASGAFRVAAWSLADNAVLMTGKSGLVLINAVATCPTRNLVAVGYANGLVSLAEIGRPSEILLREDTGSGISAMAWSGNGNYLALAGTDGTVALVEFPDSMFKS